MIAALLNHPNLIHEVFEEVGELHLSSPELDNIRRSIIEKATSDAPLDLEGLRNNLNSSGMADATTKLIAELTGPGIAKLDPLARPDATLTQVVKDWTNVSRWHQLEDLRREFEAAEVNLGLDLTEEALGRFSELQKAYNLAKADAIKIEDS